MGLKLTIDQDFKQALLARDKLKAETLRSLRNAILNEEINQDARQNGLSDQDIINCLKTEARKRQEAANMYMQAGSTERANQELAEKAIIDQYLPEDMPEEEVRRLVDVVISESGTVTAKDMGKIISEVKKRSNNLANGALIAKIVKSKL